MERALIALLRASGAAVLLLGLAACAAVPAASAPRFRALALQPGDGLTVQEGEGPDDVVFDITSEKGIGKVEIERLGRAPKTVTFNLNLKGLEEFTLSWGDVAVRLQYPSRGDAILEERTGPNGVKVVVGPGDPYYMPARIEGEDQTIPLESGYFVVGAPPAFITDAPQRFSVQWIDFYR